jgi:transposase
VAETARHLGINTNMLRRWTQEYAGNPQTAFPGNGHLTPEQEELRPLRAENNRLKMERDMLKNRVVALARPEWVAKLPSVGYRGSEGGATVGLLVGLTPVKNLVQGTVRTCEW